MISSFPSKKFFNPGGYTSFQFIPEYNLLSYPMISAGQVVVPVGMITGTDWLTGYATPGTLVFTEEPAIDENGIYYNLTVAGFAPGDKRELVDNIQQMENGVKHLVKMRDSFNKMRLIGSPSVPMTFSATFGSGGQRSEQKGFNFKFTGQCMFRAPEYNV